jgi:hypothetical protein
LPRTVAIPQLLIKDLEAHPHGTKDRSGSCRYRNIYSENTRGLVMQTDGGPETAIATVNLTDVEIRLNNDSG